MNLDRTRCQLAIGFILLGLTAVVCADDVGPLTPTVEIASKASRVLSFPADGWMGNLYVEPESGSGWDTVGVRFLGVWDYLAAARGDVVAPGDRRVKLGVRLDLSPREASQLRQQNPRAYEALIGNRRRDYPYDLSGLSQLDPNGLFWLSVSSPMYRRTGVAPEVFEPIGRLTGLEMLSLQSAGITAEGLACLKPLRSLKGLELTQFSLRPEDLAVLKDLSSLEYLNLNVGLTDAGFKQVAQVSGLRWLSIVGGKMWGPGLAELRKLPRLERLCFWGGAGGVSVTDRHLRYLETVTQLKSLTLYGVGQTLTDAGLASIAKIENLEELHFIRGAAKLTPAGVAHLKNLRHFKRIDFGQAWIKPEGSRYGDEVARQLATMPQLEAVRGLAYLSDEGVKALAGLPNLKELDVILKDSKLGYHGPTGLSYLAGHRCLDTLRIACGDRLPDADLASLESLSGLRELSIFFEPVSDRGMALIGKLKQLERLHVDVLTRSSLNHLNGLSNLEYLKVSGPFFEPDVSMMRADEGTLDLSGLTNLKNLALSSLCLRDEDLAFLKDLPSLEWLMVQQPSPLNGAFLRQLEGSSGLVRLWVRGLTDLKAEDLAHLNGLPKLRCLMVEGDLTNESLASLTGPACLESLHITTDYPISAETLVDLTASHPVIEHIHLEARPPTSSQPGHVLRRPQSYRQVPGTQRGRRR